MRNETRLILPDTKIENTDITSHLTTHQSRIHGLGLFAKIPVQTGDIIWKEEIDDPKRAAAMDDGPLRWTNHSDAPNSALRIRHDTTRHTLELILIALQKIPVGEEITYDYSVFGHSGHPASCNCGAPGCKGSFVLRSEWGEER